jgi:hypothetical protein
MRKSVLFAAVFALGACNGADDATTEETAANGEVADGSAASDVLEGEAPGFEAVAPGTYQVTRAGGEVDYIEIHPGMTFSRVAADGTATGGSIFMKDGKTCFLVEGQQEETCFSDSPKQPDGTMKTTAANGDVATVRSVEGKLEDHAPRPQQSS